MVVFKKILYIKLGMIILPKCYFCNKDLTLHCKPIIYKNKQIYCCHDCKYLSAKCCICGKEIKVNRFKINNHPLCSHKCQLEYLKQNNLGFFNNDLQKEMSKRSHEIQKRNHTGIFNPEVHKKVNELQKQNHTGFFNNELQTKLAKRSAEINMYNKTGIFSKEAQKKSYLSQRQNHVAIFDPKIRKIAIQKSRKIQLQSYINAINNLNLNIDFQIQDQFYSDVSYDFFQKYDKVPGIWSKELEDGTVLDVGETQDIGKEMKFDTRALAVGFKNRNSNDKDLSRKYKTSFGIHKKYRDMSNYVNGQKVVYKILVINEESREKRELIEAQYAISKHAIFWHLSVSFQKDTIYKAGDDGKTGEDKDK
jgi:hypothetical protein